MPFVERDASGAIVAIAMSATAAATEWLEPTTPELSDFINKVAPVPDEFSRSDLALIRVVEDIVNTLIEKNLIRFTDLPDAAQQKLLERRSMRRDRGPLRLFDDDPLRDLKI